MLPATLSKPRTAGAPRSGENYPFSRPAGSPLNPPCGEKGIVGAGAEAHRGAVESRDPPRADAEWVEVRGRLSG
jgi:hypothetical protein